MYNSPADLTEADEITKGPGCVEDMLQRAGVHDRIEAPIKTAGPSEVGNQRRIFVVRDVERVDARRAQGQQRQLAIGRGLNWLAKFLAKEFLVDVERLPTDRQHTTDRRARGLIHHKIESVRVYAH